jgi:hypothetical protein
LDRRRERREGFGKGKSWKRNRKRVEKRKEIIKKITKKRKLTKEIFGKDKDIYVSSYNLSNLTPYIIS